MAGFSLPYRLDRNCNGGGVMIFVREDIPSKLLTNIISQVMLKVCSLSFRKSKWLLCDTYHPPAQNDQYFFNFTDKGLDTYSNYDNVLLAGDFNAEDDPCLSNFLYKHDLYHLVKIGSCFKNSSKPTSIALFLTTNNTHFQTLHEKSYFPSPGVS